MKLERLERLRNGSRQALDSVDLQSVAALIGELLAVRARGGLVLLAGNGGSASTCAHMASDLMFGSRLSQPALRVVALVDNTCMVTATGNDVGYESVFSRQIEALGTSNDLLVVLTASGNSPNVLAAVNAANNLGMRTIALTGFDGGQVSTMVDLNVHVQTELGAYGPVEDAHLAINHIVTQFLREAVAGDPL